MSTQGILSIKEAAEKLGVHPKTASQVLKARGIKTLPLPHNGNGKGLDDAAMAELREALTPRKRARRERKTLTA